MPKQGIILNNIGTPSGSDPGSVGIYLKEFLMDEDVIGLPLMLRYILVHWLIVPRRQESSAKKYQKVWGAHESPLMEISKAFADGVQSQLGSEYSVELGMRYGKPSLEEALAKMQSRGVKEILLAPLFPQYAKATSFSAEKATKSLIAKNGYDFQLKTLPPFFNQKEFLQLSSQKLKTEFNRSNWDHVLFSFHGLPESQVREVPGCLADPNCCENESRCALNCYRAQCFSTARSLALGAQIPADRYTICFQSRLGPAKWIGPASIDVVRDLAKSGSRRVLVQSPSFVADCLETLEEISIELNAEFQAHGGEVLQLVPCLNHDFDWVQAFSRHLIQTKVEAT